MDDLISRQAAIDAMCSVCGNDCDKSEFVYDAPQWEQVILCPEHYALSVLPSVQPEPQWISCSDRLPDVSGRYLVTRGLKAAGAIWDRVYIVNFSDLMGLKPNMIFWQGNVGKSDFERLDDVLAWMPIPARYTEDAKCLNG